MAFFVSSTRGAAAVGVGVAADALRPRCAAARLGTTVRSVRAIERRDGRRMGISVRYPGSDTSAQRGRWLDQATRRWSSATAHVAANAGPVDLALNPPL